MRPPSFDPSGGGAGVLAPPEPRVRRRGRDRHVPAPPPPPHDGGDGGGWGRGEGGEDPAPDGRPPGTASFALGLAMAGISTLFLTLLAVWLLLRRGAPDPSRASSLVPPDALWASTAVLLASSFAVERAARLAAMGGGPQRGVARWLGGSLFLGLLFLVAQSWLWWRLVELGLVPASGGWAALFYTLTGLHAVHVAGGIVAMGGTLVRWQRAASLSAVTNPPRCARALRLCASYWHFMGVVWVVLFAVLYFLR